MREARRVTLLLVIVFLLAFVSFNQLFADDDTILYETFDESFSGIWIKRHFVSLLLDAVSSNISTTVPAGLCYVALELSPSNHPRLFIPSRKTQNLHLNKQASKQSKTRNLETFTYSFVSYFKNPTSNNMAFRSMGYWKSLASRLSGKATYATSTAPKLKSYAPAADQFGHHYHQESKHGKKVRGEFVPVFVALGMIALSISLGLYTAKQQVLYAPNVRVRKKTRETIPEVVDPDKVVEEADKFIKKSLFRKVAHVQEFDHNGLKYLPEPRAETLREVGVDPKLQL